jgi:O-methyltransferase
MPPTPTELYLELLKKALAFSLWPEPPVPVEEFAFLQTRRRRQFHTWLASILRRRNLQLARTDPISESERHQGKIWPRYADTMIGHLRLDNLQFCIETALAEGVPGDLMETGVWRGGACIFMRGVLAAHGVTNRRVILADSFEGLPKPDSTKWPADQGDRHHTFAPYLAVTQTEVENNFRRYGLLDGQVVFLKGWFADTLPSAPVAQLAVLRLDGDMYGSTMEALVHLYPKLARGGFCIIDDYGLPGCRQAVDEYRRKNNITGELTVVDWTGRYWRRE